MLQSIQLPQRWIDSGCKSRHSLSVINKLEFDSIPIEQLSKNKLPILLSIINNFPKVYSNNFIAPEKGKKKTRESRTYKKFERLLKKLSYRLIKRKIKVLTCRYRILIAKKKQNSQIVDLLKPTLLQIKRKITKLKKLKDTPEKLVRTGAMGERYVYNDLDETFHTNIMFQIDGKQFGFIYDEGSVSIECEVVDKKPTRTIRTIDRIEIFE